MCFCGVAVCVLQSVYQISFGFPAHVLTLDSNFLLFFTTSGISISCGSVGANPTCQATTSAALPFKFNFPEPKSDQQGNMPEGMGAPLMLISFLTVILCDVGVYLITCII